MEHGGALQLPPGVALFGAEVLWVSTVFNEVSVLNVGVPGCSEAIIGVLFVLPFFGGNGGPQICFATTSIARLSSLKVEFRDISTEARSQAFVEVKTLVVAGQ